MINMMSLVDLAIRLFVYMCTSPYVLTYRSEIMRKSSSPQDDSLFRKRNRNQNTVAYSGHTN